MAIVRRSQLFQSVLLASVISLVACGGGGGKKRDTTPDGFTYTASTNAATSAAVTSPTVTISGINTSTPVSISGGEYSINGGAFTSAAGTITNGQTLAVRITASDKTNTPKEATITVGGVSAKFTVTTAADVTPDAFTFSPKNEATVNTEYTSDSITVKGIDIAVPVSITGGTYSINGGAYTAAAGTVSADQTITVKATSGSDTETTQNAVLTVGGVTGTFAVTTIADTTPPVAEFKFPTPYTMSEASEVKVRGTATDDHAITSVKLVIRSFNIATPDVTIETKEVIAAPKSEANGVKDFSSWTATIPLTATAENEVKVVATDDRENEIAIEQANKVVIRQADVSSAFPDEVNQFGSPSGGIVYDHWRNRLLVSDSYDESILAVDLTSGSRSIFKDMNGLGNDGVWGMLIDNVNDEPVLYALEYENGNLHEIDLSTAEILSTFNSGLYREPRSLIKDEVNETSILISINDDSFQEGNNSIISFDINSEIFSTFSESSDSPDFKSSWGIALDKKNNRYLVSKGNQNSDANMHGLYAINRSTGQRTLFASNLIGSGDDFSADTVYGKAFLRDISVDLLNNRVLVPESITGKLFSINLDSADRKVIANFSYKDSSTVKPYVFNINLDSSNDVVFLTESQRNAVLLVDLNSGDKVIISKSKND